MSFNQSKVDDLKKQIKVVLDADIVNNNLLLELTNELADLDQNTVRFSVDAGLIDRLGQELVSRQETAVSELVKNAYDADAKEVTLTFIDSDTVGGTLIIEDDGDGMTRDELVNGFMRISSTDKIHNPVSKRFHRQRAGQKGIGRFAVQRLGQHLKIITETENSQDALKLKVNWNNYVKDNNLLSVTNELEVIEPSKINGTKLIIEGLRDKWTVAAIKRVYRYVSNIIQPFPLAGTQVNQGNLDANPGFQAKFIKISNGVKQIVADAAFNVYQHAVAEIEGYIDESGVGVYTVDSKRLGINDIGEIGNDPDDSKVPFSFLRNVRFRAYYFLYDADLIPKMHISGIQKLARKEGGIRLYRNGFRVLPYAESGDDWLDLDQSSRRRSVLFPHANNNFFGFVELKDLDNTYNETSSREGIIENEAFRELRNFVHRTIITAVVKVAHVRNTKITTGQKKDENGKWEEIQIRVRDIALSLEDLDKELDENNIAIETKSRRKKKLAKIKQEIKDLQEIQASEIKKSLKERSMLRVLSSVGLTTSQFIHEIKYYMDNIQSDVRFLLKELEGHTSALARINILDANFRNFHTYTSYFNDIVSQNVIRDLAPINLIATVKKFISSMQKDAENAGVVFLEPKFNKLWLYTKPMHPSEWSSILFNFYTNSKKAIKRASVSGRILIECGESEGTLYLEFTDNGDGIGEDHKDKIFDEFFTTTAAQSLDVIDSNTENLGTGLGLKIVQDIIKSYRGNVLVVSPKEDFSTCIRVEIGKASEKELEDYGL